MGGGGVRLLLTDILIVMPPKDLIMLEYSTGSEKYPVLSKRIFSRAGFTGIPNRTADMNRGGPWRSIISKYRTPAAVD